jgi:hypothetical protein
MSKIPEITAVTVANGTLFEKKNIIKVMSHQIREIPIRVGSFLMTTLALCSNFFKRIFSL